MISESSINEVKAKMDIHDVVSEYVKLKKVGHDYKGSCPFHNEKTPSFSVDPNKQICKCFGCGKGGDAIQFLQEYKKVSFIEAIKILAQKYNVELIEEDSKRPKVRPTSQKLPLTINQYEWFRGRGIEKEILDEFKITNSQEWMPGAKTTVNAICFNYFRKEELINVKYRAAKKDFKLAKDAELIFYNIDAVDGKDYVIIVEGEMDCISVSQCGVKPVISVPNGASVGVQRLEYLDNCWECFVGKTSVVIMTDNDAPGILLRDELARRIGIDRCYKPIYPEGCKDANDILVKLGKDALLAVIKNVVEFPIEGILTIDDMYMDIRSYYTSGYPDGVRAGIKGFDDYVSFMLGQYSTITGIPGSGKSEFVDYIMVMLAKNHYWNFGVCSFENQPSSLHATKLMEKAVGKSFAHRENTQDRINGYEFDSSMNFISEHFYFINISQIDVTLSGILSKARELVLRKGIKGLLIDPWNYIEHKIPQGYTETQYISECLTAIKAFAITNGIHIFLIAHPTKLQKENGKYVVPTLYHISGSAHFFNKTDNGITVYRDFATNQVEVHIQKVRYSWLGKIGMCNFNYNTYTRQYIGEGQPF